MIVTTNGIVLSTVRYSDSSVIARIYTEQVGLQSCMVRTGKGKNALPKLAMLQPLSLVELSFTNDERRSLRNLRSLERETALNGIPFDTVKTCVALFMAEVIGRAIAEEEGNPGMFSFLRNSILMLDQAQASVNNFHLKFLIEFSRYLGFYPHDRSLGQPYFDLMEGEFCSVEPLHPYVMRDALVDRFDELKKVEMPAHATVRMSTEVRRELLQKLIDYYRLHLQGIKEISAHKVLEEVLS